jgi:translation initiation factor 3 subunit B
MERFKQFLWRPRPPTLLAKEQQRKVRKNLKEYSRTFDEEDAAEESNVSAELIALRKRLVEDWNAYRAKCRKDIADERQGAGKRRHRHEVSTSPFSNRFRCELGTDWASACFTGGGARGNCD